MEHDVKSLQRKAIQYWWIDGLAEIGFGFEMLVISLYFVLLKQIQSVPWTMIVSSVGLPIVLLATFYLTGKLVLYFKEKITFPRTGYVRYPKRKAASRKRRMIVGGVMGLTTAVSINLTRVFLGVNAQWIVVSLIFMMSMIYIGYLAGVYRYYVLGVLTFIWGVILIQVNIADNYEYVWLFGGIGLISFLFGAVIFLRYLKQHPENDGDEYGG